MTEASTQATREVVAAELGRRSVLRAACGVCTAAAGAVVLAACGSGGSPEPQSGASPWASTSQPETSPPGSTVTGSPTTTGSAAPPAAAGGIPVGEVPVGGGAVFPDDGVVITQPTAGEFHAFDITCPHQQNPVGLVRGDVIVCTHHGSTFDSTTGERVAGPAPTGLTRRPVTVEGDRVVVT